MNSIKNVKNLESTLMKEYPEIMRIHVVKIKSMQQFIALQRVSQSVRLGVARAQ
jgi:hypothetical protein